uniref:SBP-type domain-containing protein n=1 Tax=Tetradesmus obliquus TaxID=3088 RepID=A0A383VLL0_TETOB|eukprot:jgi/Sobl393_1/16557/SZX66427.1
MTRGKLCKVLGCDAIIDERCSKYQQKKRVCAEHLQADAVRCKRGGNELYRFCQQCGKLEQLNRFQGKKRSCRMSLAKRRTNSSHLEAQRSEDTTPAASPHPTFYELWPAATPNSNSCTSDSTQRCGDACAISLATAAPASQPAPADAAALLAEAWCSADGLAASELDLEDADEDSIMLMLEHELLAAAAAAAPAAAAPAAPQQPLQLQLPSWGCIGDTSNVLNTNKTICASAAPAAMSAAAGVPSRAAARLHLLKSQFAALQAELMVLQDMRALLQQLNGHGGPDASCVSAGFAAQLY